MVYDRRTIWLQTILAAVSSGALTFVAFSYLSESNRNESKLGQFLLTCGPQPQVADDQAETYLIDLKRNSAKVFFGTNSVEGGLITNDTNYRLEFAATETMHKGLIVINRYSGAMTAEWGKEPFFTDTLGFSDNILRGGFCSKKPLEKL